ncbi:MAG: Gfo/Idh/MocA family protein [Acidobacteriota bacterium]
MKERIDERTAERRDFLKTAMAGLMVLFTEEELRAAAILDQEEIKGPPVRFGLIGIGQWGRELLTNLSRLPMARVTMLCDTYEPALKKGLELAPKATTNTDYRRLLESPEVEAVIVATPTHQHREIVLAALQAGKHVYCEAPLAHTIDDAAAIARAARQATGVKFQAGLQGRSNALYRHIIQFVQTGVLGAPAQVYSQWNRKLSWRRPAPTPEREREINWHLTKATSIGIPGELGIHQFDLTSWYLRSMPVAVQGSGSVMNWNDGREIPDTIQVVFEHQKSLRQIFVATLASSFSGSYTLMQGSDSSLMLRENRGWMIKEADSPLLGWEVYAKKEDVHNETGICMVADATKLLEAGKEPGQEGSMEPTRNAPSLAFYNFIRSIREDTPVAATALHGYQATVVAIRAHEAVMSGSRVEIPASLYELK